MTSAPVRDPLADHLITPLNAALLLIDYQPAQVASVRSMDQELLVRNAVSTVRTIKAFDVPVVHSTVNVAAGQGPTIPELSELLADDKPLDRTTVNSWEDVEFLDAVRATGRRKLIFCALWTEVCMTFTALDALSEGYEVYPVVDAIGGTSPEAHRAGLERVVQAGGQPVSWVSLACELQRDWARQDTVADIIEIVLTDRLRKELGGECRRHVGQGPGRAEGLQDGRAHLRGADPVLAELIAERPDFDPRRWLTELPPMDLFGALLFQVTGQQLSVAATRRTLASIEEGFGERLPTPAQVLDADPAQFRHAGLSWRKSAPSATSRSA
jgi:nicotinamidase-related amidase